MAVTFPKEFPKLDDVIEFGACSQPQNPLKENTVLGEAIVIARFYHGPSDKFCCVISNPVYRFLRHDGNSWHDVVSDVNQMGGMRVLYVDVK